MFAEISLKIQESDPNAFVILGDIGVFSFRESFSRFPQRTINVGVLEQTMIGIAAGLSLSGKIPIVHTIAPFLVERAYEQIKVDFGYQKLSGNLVSVGASFDYGFLGSTHYCPADICILSQIPEMQIFVPGTSDEFQKLFLENYNKPGCRYFRLTESENSYSLPLSAGKSMRIKEGARATVVAVGPVLDLVLEACHDKEVEIIYINTLNPGDAESIVRSCESHKLIIVEPYYSGGLLSYLTPHLKGQHFWIEQIGIQRKFPNNYGTSQEISEELGLSNHTIRECVERMISE